MGWAQADADRMWYEGEAGRRQAAQAAAEAQRQAEQAQRKVHYQDLQAAAVLRHKEAQLLEHRSAAPLPKQMSVKGSIARTYVNCLTA